MALNNVYSWTGTLGSEWSQLTPTQSNWALVMGKATQPNYPQGAGDVAQFEINASLTSDNGSASAELWGIDAAVTVTLLSGHFEAGIDGGSILSGFVVGEGGTLIVATVDGVVGRGGLDVIGSDGGGTLELQSGAGFVDHQMDVGAGTNGAVTVNGATFEVVQSGATDGVLTIGLRDQNDGNGSVDIFGNSLFFAVETTVGKDLGSTGELTLDGSTWGGTNLLIGPAGTGTVTIKNGSSVALSNVFIAGAADSQGSFDITGSTVILAGAMEVGRDAGANGELTVNNSSLKVAFDSIIAPAGSDTATIENGSNAQLNGNLIIGETDGSDGSLDVSGSTLSVGGTTTVGQDSGATGALSLDDTTWTGADVTVGGAGAGTVAIKDGSSVTLNSIVIGARGELDVTAVGGSTTTLSVPSLTLAFGALTVSGGGEVNMNAPGVQGAVDVATTLVGLGTINGNIVVEQSGVVQADQPLEGTLTVNGNIHGTGTIEPLRTLEANGGIDGGITIQFRAPSAGTSAGVLQLDVPRADDGTITNFSAGNTIKIEGLVYNQALFTPGTPGNVGVLTLSGGSDAPLELKVDGNYAPGAFLATPGANETVVTLSPVHDPSFPRADLTGDGASDLLMDNQLVVGSLSGGSLNYTAIGALGPEWEFNGTGNFIGDGRQGVLLFDSENNQIWVAEDVNGAARYSEIGGVGSEWQFVGNGPFLGHGLDDILIRNTLNGGLVAGEVSGGTLQYTSLGSFGTQLAFEGTGDYLGDGNDAFLVRDSATGQLSVSGGTAQLTAVGGLGAEWQFAGSGDLLGDGRADFLIWNSSNGALDVGEIAGGAAQYTAVGGLGSEWQFLGTGKYTGTGATQDTGPTEFAIRNTANGQLWLGAVNGGSVAYTQIGGVGPEWTFPINPATFA